MTEKTVEMAERVLPEYGLTNKQSEHPWNMVQFEGPDFGEIKLVVWGRHWSGLKVQMTQGDESMIELGETEDEEVLRKVLDVATDFLKRLEALAREHA